MKKTFLTLTAAVGIFVTVSAQNAAVPDNCGTINALIKDLNETVLTNYKGKELKEGVFASKVGLKGFSINEIIFDAYGDRFSASTAKIKDVNERMKIYSTTVEAMKTCLKGYSIEDSGYDTGVSTSFSTEANPITVSVMSRKDADPDNVTILISKNK